MSEPALDDTNMDKAYQELGGHDTDSQVISKSEKELLDEVDKALDSVE